VKNLTEKTPRKTAPRVKKLIYCDSPIDFRLSIRNPERSNTVEWSHTLQHQSWQKRHDTWKRNEQPDRSDIGNEEQPSSPALDSLSRQIQVDPQSKMRVVRWTDAPPQLQREPRDHCWRVCVLSLKTFCRIGEPKLLDPRPDSAVESATPSQLGYQ